MTDGKHPHQGILMAEGGRPPTIATRVDALRPVPTLYTGDLAQHLTQERAEAERERHTHAEERGQR